MINLTILVLVLIVSLSWGKDEYDFPKFIPFLTSILSGVLILIHLIQWLTVPISFDSFKARHDQLRIDLELSRQKTDPYERMAMLQEITEHNQTIAENKQLNNNLFMDQYIDDRVESLETIQ